MRIQNTQQAVVRGQRPLIECYKLSGELFGAEAAGKGSPLHGQGFHTIGGAQLWLLKTYNEFLEEHQVHEQFHVIDVSNDFDPSHS